jgi:hypothetical protein
MKYYFLSSPTCVSNSSGYSPPHLEYKGGKTPEIHLKRGGYYISYFCITVTKHWTKQGIKNLVWLTVSKGLVHRDQLYHFLDAVVRQSTVQCKHVIEATPSHGRQEA